MYGASGNLLRRYINGPDTDEPLVWYEGSGYLLKLCNPCSRWQTLN